MKVRLENGHAEKSAEAQKAGLLAHPESSSAALSGTSGGVRRRRVKRTTARDTGSSSRSRVGTTIYSKHQD